MTDTQTLRMSAPVEKSLLDTATQGLIGLPLDRKDGPLKVAGRATYAAEYALNDVAYGVLVGAPVGLGKLKGIDDTAARAVPGVIDVVVDLDRFARNPQQGGEETAPTQGVKDIDYWGQHVALVVAESFEAAREGAAAVVLDIAEGTPDVDFDGRLDDAEKPADSMIPAHSESGNPDAALTAAAVSIDHVWTTPSQHSAAMEPHATIADWQDDRLTLYSALQMPASDKKQMMKALDLKADEVRIVARFVGGGFGSKLGVSTEGIAAAIASQQLGRPVKVVMARQQVFDATVRRSNTSQRVALGADADGKLTTIIHDTITSNLPGEDFFEPAGLATHFMYSGDNRRVNHDLVRMNWLLSGSMRAPGEAVGMIALECAMDELAEAAGLDPIELRRRNEPDVDPEKGVPFSTRNLTRCMEEGAKVFGWAPAEPATTRDGEWLVGTGMAASARTNLTMPSSARITLTPSGTAIVETDMTDIGTGTYTILAQIAGELLGLAMPQVDVRLGDTDMPPGAGSGGSWGAGSAGSSVYLAAEKLRENIAKAMDCDATELTLKDGLAIANNRSVPLADLVGDGMVAEGVIKPGKNDQSHTQAAYGAHFCEVRVNATTGETRVSRWHSTFAAGRILNEKTARSQCFGGIVFGIGAALTEEMVHDPRTGQVVNHDLAEYHVPANADVPMLGVDFLVERDPWANPLQAKGIGELGISGAAAAVANAIYNATGVRVRELPITLDKLLAGLPER
ncbi:xanthine dehydrogenase family protein molybdopterin-binding subunit [Sphingomonas donggukensis]|uniref:Xanthine dehydrogenase family protein molybdopterin-binding subunit n=1 Tax=Sphingomonas donggukensis TaxID=2949093 RepID=A0ABY4TTD5_9SPHN|nr:xanthine dehydrogenase family protein molybdopterin-binding subunit [Sphingomonas donggukensis]URW75675.1 xanthine dehydrogenase family protein molybdopterin-binding subunit [Sphingomonas donggukensis]